MMNGVRGVQRFGKRSGKVLMRDMGRFRSNE